MKMFFPISQVMLVMMMSVFLFSCEKTEMDDLVPAAQASTYQAEAKVGKKTKKYAPVASQPADSVYIVSFYDPNNTLNTEVAVQNLATSIGGPITFQQTYWEGVKGFAAPLTALQVYTFRNDSRVEVVEADGPIYPYHP
jgi:hypothetical protein